MKIIAKIIAIPFCVLVWVFTKIVMVPALAIIYEIDNIMRKWGVWDD